MLCLLLSCEQCPVLSLHFGQACEGREVEMKYPEEPQTAGFKWLTWMHRLHSSILVSVPTQKAYKPEL
jgi:hypothetical protein